MKAARIRNTARHLLNLAIQGGKEGDGMEPLRTASVMEEDWTPEARERFKQLLETRRRHEAPFHSSSSGQQEPEVENFDIKNFLSNAIEENAERQEAALIIKCFRESTCRVFIPVTDPDDDHPNIEKLPCRVCGLTADLHTLAETCEDGSGDHALNVPLNLANTSWPSPSPSDGEDEVYDDTKDDILLTPLVSTDLPDGSRRFKDRTPTTASQFASMSFGSVLVPARFVGQKQSNASKEPFLRKYMKFDAVHGKKKLQEMADLLDLWQLPPPSFILSITGGSLENAAEKTINSIAESIKSISNNTDLWILSDGRNAGTSRYIGRLFHTGSENTKIPVLVSLSHWGSLDRKELLMGISLPKETKSSRYFYAMEYRLSRQEDPRVLNPYQQAYLLLDNGESVPGRTVQDFRRKFEDFLRYSSHTSVIEDIEVTVPMVTLVIGGDQQTLSQVVDSVKSQNPVVIVNGSGKIPSLLSDIYFELEDAFPRSLNEHCGWTNREQRLFREFIKKYSARVRGVFKCMTSKSDNQSVRDAKSNLFKIIVEGLREIMQRRYYIMVIETTDSEVQDNFYSSILQVIYTGSTRSSGLVVALNAGSPEFMEALFNRDVDPQFKMNKDYIDAGSLASLHRQNFGQDGSMGNVLKLISKRQSLNDTSKEGDPTLVLQTVGRILHLLMGPKYKLLYHEPPFTEISKSGNVAIGKKRFQIWHLFLWSVLSGKPALTQFFILRGHAPLGMALLACKLYSGISRYANKIYEEELAEYLSKAADHFERMAIGMLDKMYDINWVEAYRVLISEIPLDLGPYVTPLVVADDSEAMEFMQHACCQTYLQRIWKGNMGMETPSWMSFAGFAPLLVIPFIHFEKYPEEIPDVHLMRSISGEQPGFFEKTLWKLKCYYTAPMTKFYVRMCSYMTFLFLISYYVLIELNPFISMKDIGVVEWLLMFWLIAIVADEIYQIVCIRDTGPLYGVEPKRLRNSIWHRYEIVKMKVHILDIHMQSGWSNVMDAIMILLYIVGFSLRFSLTIYYFQLVRIIFSVALILSYFRLLSFWYILKAIGPRIIAINMMLVELRKFLLVLAVFIISFGIAFQAILQPGQEPSMGLLVNIVWRPYWQMFGELFVEDFEGMATNQNATCISVNGEPTECFMWAAPVLLAVYLLISNVLLLNLLIAIFSQAYEEVQTQAHTVWLYNLYGLIQEFYYVSWLPPPLGIFHYMWAIFGWCCRCRNKAPVVFEEDRFRLPQLSLDHDLQKRACNQMDLGYFQEDSAKT